MLISSMYPLLTVELPTVPQPVMNYTLLLAIRDVCASALCWTSDISVTFTGATTYTLVPPTGTEIVEPRSIVTDTGVRLTLATPDQMDQTDPLWRTRVGSATKCMSLSLNTMQFTPKPPTGSAIVTAALQPTMAATDIDERMGSRFFEVFVNGALARLYRMKTRPWGDERQAQIYEALFGEGMRQAQTAGSNGYAKTVRRVHYGGY